VGSSRAGETGSGGADHGRAPALERLGLPLRVAASRGRRLGLAGVARSFGARLRIVSGSGLGRACIACAGLGLPSRGACGARRAAGPGPDVGLTAGPRGSRRRADLGLSRSRTTARGGACCAGLGGCCSGRTRTSASG
jgi:hypothetical protein